MSFTWQTCVSDWVNRHPKKKLNMNRVPSYCSKIQFYLPTPAATNLMMTELGRESFFCDGRCLAVLSHQGNRSSQPNQRLARHVKLSSNHKVYDTKKCSGVLFTKGP